MEYNFLTDTYDSERLKTLNVWSMFTDDDLFIRPHPLLQRDRNALEHMIHQCLGENKWFCNMFDIDVGAPPLPGQETRLEFIKRYAEDSGKRLAVLKEKDNTWWEQKAAFFDTRHSRAWIMVRRIAHTAHHRGEMTTLLRLLKRKVHSVYGPSVDTFKELYKNKFRYEGNRAILFSVNDKIPVRELSHCIAMALTYHLNKKNQNKQRHKKTYPII